MKRNTKSSITLPSAELKLVKELAKKLDAKSNVEVIRRGLKLLKDQTDRAFLRAAFQDASLATRENVLAELEELDNLSGEGID
jgi:hypothetical protein